MISTESQTRPFSLSILLFFLAGVFVVFAGEVVQLRVLQTADLHACVDQSPTRQASWLQIASIVKRERRVHGGENLLLIDCGDTCQGSLEGRVTRGEVAIQMLKSLEYDVWVPGNHEFDFGLDRYDRFVEWTEKMVLCGNVRRPGRPHLPGWRMFTRSGARIAVIGCNASYIKNWFPEADLEVRTAVDQIEECLPAILREKPDAIILAIHQGWLEVDHRQVNEIPEIVKRFPEIDLILGAHTHRPRPGRRLGVHTWYMQPAAHARHLAAATLKVDVDRHKVLDVNSSLIEVTGDTPAISPDASLLPLLEKSRRFSRRVVGTLREPIRSAGFPGRNCGTAELIAKALAEGAEAPIAIQGKHSSWDLAAGQVTERDLFELIPYENEVFVVWLTRRELEKIVTEQYAWRKSYVFCGVYGAEFDIDAREKARLRHPERFFKKSKRVPVVLNSYTFSGGGGRFAVLRETVSRSTVKHEKRQKTTRQLLREFLGGHPNLSLSPNVWLYLNP